MDMLNLLLIIGTFIGIAGAVPGTVLSVLLLKDRWKNKAYHPNKPSDCQNSVVVMDRTDSKLVHQLPIQGTYRSDY
jgi:hypothetical protein